MLLRLSCYPEETSEGPHGHLPRAVMERGVDKDLGEVSTVPMKDFVANTDEKE